ncbi:MAG: ribbon-helix-helix protein, CopG family [Acidimicrobiales bacterium]
MILPPNISLYNTLVEIRYSALKHGCSPNDVLHAITNALVAYDDLDDPYVLYLGPDTAGTLLEVLTAVDEQGEEIAFHAMPMRQVQEAAPMTEPRKAKTGESMDDAFWRRAEEKADAGLDASRLRRRVGRPTLGADPAELTAVRLPPEIRRALDDRAAQDHTSASEVIRRALDQYLAS